MSFDAAGSASLSEALRLLIPGGVSRPLRYLVIVELEGIAERFFSGLGLGHWKSEYTAGKPDLGTSPIPAATSIPPAAL